MNKNIIKNILVGVSALAVIVISLISNPFNIAGMIVSIVSVILLALLLFLYRKEDDLTSKSDIYLLLLITGIIGGKFGTLANGFNQASLSNALSNIKGLGFLFIVLAIIATAIFNKIFKKVAMVKRMLSIIAITFALAFTMGGNLSVYDYFILGAIICFYLFTSTLNDIGKPNKAFGRNYWLTLVTMAIFLFRRLLFPSYSYSEGSLIGTLNFKILPFYCLIALILVSAVVIGLDADFNGAMEITNDMILFGGLASLAFVIKCSVFFHFYYSWIGILIGVFILIATAFRHSSSSKKNGARWFDLDSLSTNPLFIMIIAELLLGFAISQICYGHVYFAFALFISIFFITVIPKAFRKGWRRDIARSFAYAFSIALMACARVVSVGYSLKKILLIVAIFIFTAAILYFIDHNNEVGHNKYTAGRIAVIIISALLMLIPIYKGGSKVKIKAEDKDSLVSNFVIEPVVLSVKAKADGKDNDVRSVKYVFSDNYKYDPSRVIEVDVDEFTVDLDNSHLIVWVTDTNGMETRRDFWFETYYNMNSDYVGGTFLQLVENRDAVKSGQNYKIYDKRFYGRIEDASWADYGYDLETGKFYRDVPKLSFYINSGSGVSGDLYYAYYYSDDKEFSSEDLETPVYSYTVSSKDNQYDLVCRSKIEPGYYVLVVTSDKDSLEEAYLIAYAKVLNEEAPRAEAEIRNDQNRVYLQRLPDDIVSYYEGYIVVDTSLYETSYSELQDMAKGGLTDLTEWDESDLEVDSVSNYGPVAFKFYDEICVSMIYSYSAGSYDIASLRDIFAQHLGACDDESYDQDTGELKKCSWYGSDINIYLYHGASDQICCVEFESVASVIEE